MIENFINILKDYFFQIIIGTLILLIGFIIGTFTKKISKKALEEINFNKILRTINYHNDGEEILSSILSYIIYLISIIFFLTELGITSIVLYLILGAILMVVILTFLVGIKDLIPNFVAWTIIKSKSKLKEGTKVEIKEIKGTIENIGLLETEIRTINDDLLYVPNSLFIKSKFRIRE